MNLYRITNAKLAFGDNPLLNNATFHINKGERICIVGRNGAGKSTLMKVVAGEIQLDDGEINTKNGTTIGRLEQDPPKASQDSIYEFVASGLGEVGALLAEFSKLARDENCDMDRFSDVQHKIENADGWRFEPTINAILSRLHLDASTMLTDLSGGWLRKVALARALVIKPDILLLDEPTNHLDYQSIEWLETFLKDYSGAIVFISHDRAFIRSVAERIVDLERGTLINFELKYDEYLVAKEEHLKAEAEENRKFDIRLAEEEVWIRQGIKARRTRNEGRVRALQAMRKDRQQRQERQGKVSFNVGGTERSGKLVAEITNLSYAFDNKVIVKDFNSLIMRGDKVGLIGPNGCGKSTFIKLILETLTPDSGDIRLGTKLDIVYFDQYRQQLDESQTVVDNVGEGRDTVTVNGVDRHVLGYLQDFLFSPQRARSPVSSLSGGEKNRLLLAKLFLKPANLMILDEPTNDLDIETLELLEELISGFDGTLIIVSHDREFVNNTVTSSYFFEGDGVISDYVGGYDEIARFKEINITLPEPKVSKSVKKTEIKPAKKQKLSFKQKRELELLPAKIETLEGDIEAVQATINTDGFFAKPDDETASVLESLAKLEQELEQAFAEWEALDAIENQS